MTNEVELRVAVTDDAAALAQLQIDCWEEAYRGLMPDATLAESAASLEHRTRGWGQILAAATDPVVLAMRGSELVGFGSAGPNRDEDAPAPREVYALYARRALWGSGLGARLLDSVLTDEAHTLWVLDPNPRAQAFYAKHGFSPDGAVVVDERHGNEIRLARPSP